MQLISLSGALESAAMLKAIVTGASGFIGSALTLRLLSDGWDVTAVGRDAARLPPGAEPIVVGLYTFEELTAALAGKKCDVVFHLAAYGVTPTDRDPETMRAANVEGTAAMTRAALRIGAGALVYAGTMTEYAHAKWGKAIDEGHPLTADGLYGPSKVAGGRAGRDIAAGTDLTFQWLRIFGVFGPREAPHRLMPAIANRLSRNLPVDLSPGKQIRDVLYIDEVVAGLVLCAEAALRGEGGPLNLCSGRPVSVRSMALELAAAMGRPSRLLRFGALPYRPGEPMWLLGDATAFKRTTGAQLDLPLRAAITRFVGDFHSGRPIN